jgi:hypothetical protein
MTAPESQWLTSQASAALAARYEACTTAKQEREREEQPEEDHDDAPLWSNKTLTSLE